MMPSAVIAYLSIVYEDGEPATLISDESWQVYTTEVTFADIYDGETIDKTAERAFLGNAVEKTVKTRIIKQVGEDIVENERLKPLSLIITKKGERVIPKKSGVKITFHSQLFISNNISLRALR